MEMGGRVGVTFGFFGGLKGARVVYSTFLQMGGRGTGLRRGIITGWPGVGWFPFLEIGGTQIMRQGLVVGFVEDSDTGGAGVEFGFFCVIGGSGVRCDCCCLMNFEN